VPARNILFKYFVSVAVIIPADFLSFPHLTVNFFSDESLGDFGEIGGECAAQFLELGPENPYGQKIKTAANMTVVQAFTMEQLSAPFPTAPHGSA
jgi:hypothetical protein